MCPVKAINKLNLTTPKSLVGDFQQLSSFLNFPRVICFPLPRQLRPKWGWSELLDLPPTALSSRDGVDRLDEGFAKIHCLESSFELLSSPVQGPSRYSFKPHFQKRYKEAVKCSQISIIL